MHNLRLLSRVENFLLKNYLSTKSTKVTKMLIFLSIKLMPHLLIKIIILIIIVIVIKFKKN